MQKKQFITEKLTNFKKFLSDEFIKLLNSEEHAGVFNSGHVKTFHDEINFLINNVDVFISLFSSINVKDTDECIKVFLLKYNINIDDIRDGIDYNKLKRYIEMFNEVINGNINK